MDDGIHRVPDGSAFFVAMVGGPRDPGLVAWAKYTRHNSARFWLRVWRNYRSARDYGHLVPEPGPRLSRWHCARYAFGVSRQG